MLLLNVLSINNYWREMTKIFPNAVSILRYYAESKFYQCVIFEYDLINEFDKLTIYDS